MRQHSQLERRKHYSLHMQVSWRLVTDAEKASIMDKSMRISLLKFRKIFQLEEQQKIEKYRRDGDGIRVLVTMFS